MDEHSPAFLKNPFAMNHFTGLFLALNGGALGEIFLKSLRKNAAHISIEFTILLVLKLSFSSLFWQKHDPVFQNEINEGTQDGMEPEPLNTA